jgi:hypothetical protein
MVASMAAGERWWPWLGEDRQLAARQRPVGHDRFFHRAELVAVAGEDQRRHGHGAKIVERPAR